MTKELVLPTNPAIILANRMMGSGKSTLVHTHFMAAFPGAHLWRIESHSATAGRKADVTFGSEEVKDAIARVANERKSRDYPLIIDVGASSVVDFSRTMKEVPFSGRYFDHVFVPVDAGGMNEHARAIQETESTVADLISGGFSAHKITVFFNKVDRGIGAVQSDFHSLLVSMGDIGVEVISEYVEKIAVFGEFIKPEYSSLTLEQMAAKFSIDNEDCEFEESLMGSQAARVLQVRQEMIDAIHGRLADSYAAKMAKA